MDVLRSFFRDEGGVTSIEYAFIAGLVSIAIVVGATAVGRSLNNKFSNVSAALN